MTSGICKKHILAIHPKIKTNKYPPDHTLIVEASSTIMLDDEM